MWTFLLVGSFGAVGAALSAGTVAALVRYHRTGTFPGREGVTEVSTWTLAGLWVRVTIGAAVATYAVVSLSREGLL